MRYRAVVFDLGGVLLDSESAHEAAARRAAAQLGLQVPEQGWPRLRGGAYEDFFDYVLSLPGNSGRAVPPMEIVLLAYSQYHDEVRRSARLFDDALGSLQAARAAFRFVALATSSEWRLVETALRQFALAGLFDAVVCGDHLTQRKPAPEVYLVTAWLLGVRPSGMNGMSMYPYSASIPLPQEIKLTGKDIPIRSTPKWNKLYASNPIDASS